MAFTYGRKLNYENCISQKFQIKAFFNTQKIKSFKSIIISIFVICNAYLSSYFKFYRILLQRFLYFFLDNNDHKDLYDKFKPSLVIVGSMGLDADGLVLAESKKNKITSLVLNQSWDRVVCKGYPTCHPDYFFVWNNHMKTEAINYLDMSEERIKILGSPSWDYIFRKDNLLSKKEFFSQINLDPTKKTVYYPLNSAFWHDELIKNLEDIYNAIINQKLNKDLQIVMRVHPNYWADDKIRIELFNKLEIFKNLKNIYIDYNKVKKIGKLPHLEKSDLDFTLNCYNHCDICLSVISSSMIEMIFCGKPSLNFMYGKWKLPGETLDIVDYKLHHLEKLYEYDIIKHVFNIDDLFDKLNNLNEFKISSIDQKRMIDGEASVNLGKAAQVYSEEIYKLSKKNEQL